VLTPEPRRKRFAKLTGSTWHVTGTVVAGLTGAVALAFTLWPGLTPDPRAISAASMSVQKVEPRVSLGDYDTEYNRAELATLEPFEKDLPGNIVYVLIKVEGKKHGNVSLDKVDYGWPGGRRLSPATKLPSGRGFRPDTPNDQWVAPIWVSDPGLSVPFFERLLLFDGATLLAVADTPRIANQR
jgi:hypothetical protein